MKLPWLFLFFFFVFMAIDAEAKPGYLKTKNRFRSRKPPIISESKSNITAVVDEINTHTTCSNDLHPRDVEYCVTTQLLNERDEFSSFQIPCLQPSVSLFIKTAALFLAKSRSPNSPRRSVCYFPSKGELQSSSLSIKNGCTEHSWICDEKWRVVNRTNHFVSQVSGSSIEIIENTDEIVTLSRGNQGFFAMIKKGDSNIAHLTVKTNLPNGTYCNLINDCETLIHVETGGIAKIHFNATDIKVVAICVGCYTRKIKLPADSDENCIAEDTADLIELFTSVKNSPSETISQNLSYIDEKDCLWGNDCLWEESKTTPEPVGPPTDPPTGPPTSPGSSTTDPPTDPPTSPGSPPTDPSTTPGGPTSPETCDPNEESCYPTTTDPPSTTPTATTEGPSTTPIETCDLDEITCTSTTTKTDPPTTSTSPLTPTPTTPISTSTTSTTTKKPLTSPTPQICDPDEKSCEEIPSTTPSQPPTTTPTTSPSPSPTIPTTSTTTQKPSSTISQTCDPNENPCEFKTTTRRPPITHTTTKPCDPLIDENCAPDPICGSLDHDCTAEKTCDPIQFPNGCTPTPEVSTTRRPPTTPIPIKPCNPLTDENCSPDPICGSLDRDCTAKTTCDPIQFPNGCTPTPEVSTTEEESLEPFTEAPDVGPNPCDVDADDVKGVCGGGFACVRAHSPGIEGTKPLRSTGIEATKPPRSPVIEATEPPRPTVIEATEPPPPPQCGEPGYSLPSPTKRTRVFVVFQGGKNQHVFIRGGGLNDTGKQCPPETTSRASPVILSRLKSIYSIPIKHNLEGLKNMTARHVKSMVNWAKGDTLLDYCGAENGQGTFEGSVAVGTPLLKTTNVTNCAFENDFNIYASVAWMLDVDMDCSLAYKGWFNFKIYITNWSGTELGIESDVYEPTCLGTACGNASFPVKNGFHFARCGYDNVVYPAASKQCRIYDNSRNVLNKE